MHSWFAYCIINCQRGPNVSNTIIKKKHYFEAALPLAILDKLLTYLKQFTA